MERVHAGVAVTQEAGTQFGRPRSNPAIVAEELAIVATARAGGKTATQAAKLVGWSRPTLYRHQQNMQPIPGPPPGSCLGESSTESLIRFKMGESGSCAAEDLGDFSPGVVIQPEGVTEESDGNASQQHDALGVFVRGLAGVIARDPAK